MAIYTFSTSGITIGGVGESKLNLSSISQPVSVTVTSTGAANIQTGSGDDFITGSSGNDTIDGGAGSNTITGGQGNDVLIGGLDRDSFRFDNINQGIDTIFNFDITEDLLAFNFNNFILPQTPFNQPSGNYGDFTFIGNSSPGFRFSNEVLLYDLNMSDTTGTFQIATLNGVSVLPDSRFVFIGSVGGVVITAT